MNRRGFTLVEIMIVVAIIGLLVAIAVPAFMKNRRDALGTACAGQLDQVYSAKEQIAFKFNLSTSSEGWPGGDAATVVDVYIRGFSLGGGVNVCPGGGSYSLGDSVVNDDGLVIVPTCTLETEDPDHDGLTFGQEGLHIQRRSFLRDEATGTYIRNDALLDYAS